jgi:hypothetical protein
MDSLIAPTYNIRPEQKLQNHTEYPKTKISSHRPELTRTHMSPRIRIRLSTLSAKMTKHTSTASW